MPKLNLKPSHKVIRDYYATLQQYQQHAIRHEGAVSSPFETLLHICAKQINATFAPQYTMRARKGNRIVIDGAILDAYGLPLAYWEAKDVDDDLHRAIQEKRDTGYPLDNILFQTPQRAVLYQDGVEALDLNITEPANLIAALPISVRLCPTRAGQLAHRCLRFQRTRSRPRNQTEGTH